MTSLQLTKIKFASGNVLDNDSDVDSDLSVVSFEVDGQTYPAGTEIELEGGVLVINPDGSFTLLLMKIGMVKFRLLPIPPILALPRH
ncbi:Ig-like domain-containing protein [Shewanella sp. Actino-trap-3]|uniref:Ig-like domain-containing protein n=1 Tax=Shewanella sp. Actino-trap-3 TaxID=2058331 RepID=UPI0012FE9C72|nr:Ig-like domain-containing protein [Shewanella sp. Actino-trap-3]